jgi:CubicO group peptidase (beta-lactamase class C family)
MRTRFLVGLFVPGVLAAQKPAAPVAALDQSFDALMDSTLALWKVPGIGLAVFKGDHVILMKGYGFKDLDAKAPVSPKTKFAIGSVSKSFTVTGLAAQVKQGKVEWDRPVREYLPDFRMYDPVATERMTPRDLVTHRSGLPRHDLMWGASTYGREEIYQRLRYLEPTKEFRSYWQYQNLMFMTAGYLSGKVNGSSWEEVVRELVFRPLDMSTADFSVTDLQRSADFAVGYALNPKDSVIRLPYHVIDPIGPAGSINASVEEMANYTMMHANRGKFRGQEIIREQDAREMQRPQMVITPAPNGPAPYLELGDESYGMGFFITNYRGHKLVHHGGNIDGFSAELNFLPNDSIGVVVLTNLNGTMTRDFIPYLVYDRLLGLPRIDWNARFKERDKQARERVRVAQAKEDSVRRPNTSPGHPLDDYAGVYHHPAYGDITISRVGDHLQFKLMTIELPMEHFHFDVFRLKPPVNALPNIARLRWRIAFTTNADGEVTTLTAPVEPALGATTFTRKKPTDIR